MFRILKNIILLFVIFSSTVKTNVLDEQALTLYIYYDANQKASIDWFKTGLPGYIKTFRDGFYLFNFNPCQQIKLSSDGKKITCDAPDENCEMNILHSCAISKIKDDSFLGDFLTCSFEKGASTASKQCLKDQNLANEIDACTKKEGFQTCVKFSKAFERPLPTEVTPFFLIPQDFYYYPPYLSTDVMCRHLHVLQRAHPQICVRNDL